ncbi:hypothetical protein C8A05DRAFT_37055 [Staphylotrichum tortipilum]|uniref:Uncharacterized protein n=1 Tax=Staphylotrichum tortipilum TaxID=2831512 RepID=A0AAN6MG60_9PEZI|nr:hypothetical protein C8A05DRAFT_37055 [Staphylotrichum longicolle]
MAAPTSFRSRLAHTSHNLQIHPPPWPDNPDPTRLVTSPTTQPTTTTTILTPLSPLSPAAGPRSPASPLSPISAASGRSPPLSPRTFSGFAGNSAAAATGMSRFVEGSMRDRVSAVPPAGFLGVERVEERGVRERPPQVLRRPKSTLPSSSAGGWEGGVVKKTSFLAPLWDGVKEKLNLSKAKSSGSIGRVVNSVVGGEKKGEPREGREKVVQEQEQEQPAAPTPPSGAYPTREEVMESYKNLVASGFFEAHAIRGGRHPLRTAEPQGKSFAEHMAAPGGMAAPAGRPFADHVAAQQQKQQSRPPITRHNMAPPPPPPHRARQDPHASPHASPHRGTKRAPSMDFPSDAELVTRKLVKKLRHSASRISMDLTGRDHHHTHHTHHHHGHAHSHSQGGYSTTPSRPSTSSDPRPSTSSDTTSSRPRLTKPKDPAARRRLLSLARRNPTTMPDPDAMVLDDPEPEQRPRRRPHRIITPPPLSFRSLRGSRSVSGSSQQQMQSAAVVVPDEGRGIPGVPRIPREFCERMAEMVPVVVVKGGQQQVVEVGGKGNIRDSGLGGEDVENVPVWG